jgi:prophage regulatory protein
MEAAENSLGVRILRLPEVCRVVGIGRSMVYQLESEGRFPRRVRIGLRAVGWVDKEIQAWVTQRALQRP